ncbi:hypothetical protein [Nocardioides marmoraquaticus]
MAVRKESVLLELNHNFPLEAAKAAAALEIVKRQLKSLSKEAVSANRSSTDLGDGLSGAGREGTRAASGLRSADGAVASLNARVTAGASEIDRYSGRLRLFADLAAILGPSAVSIGAVALPAITGLAAQAGFAALAGGTLIGAFQGMGDALKAVNEAQLEPTAANLEKARLAMDRLSPAAQDLTQQLADLGPTLKGLRDLAATNMFPGISEGIEGLEGALPRVQNIVAEVSKAIGDIAADGGASLGSERWAEFFDFLAANAPEALRQMADATGNVAHAMGELWMAFDPLNDDFGSWLVNATSGLDAWAEGLDQTDGFQDFINYIRTTGPQVADTLGALGNAVVDIVTAAAPLGGPVLAGIEGFANAISAIAESDLGTPIMAAVAALAAFNRLSAVTSSVTATAWGGKAKSNILGMASALTTVTTAQQRAQMSVQQHAAFERERAAAIRAGVGTMAKGAAAAGALAIATSGLADGMGASNTAALGLAGTMAGPLGAAIGASIGLMMDLNAASSQLGDAIAGADSAMESGNVEAMAAAQERLSTATDKANVSMSDFRPWDVAGIGLFTGSIGKASGLIADWTGKTEEAESKQRELARATTEARLAAQDSAAYKRQAAVMRESAAAARTTASSFLDISSYAGDASLSLDQFIRKMAEQARALAEFGQNANRASRRGVASGLIDQLRQLGPDGALRLKQLANATDAEIRRMNRAFNSGEEATRQYERSLGLLPEEVVTRLETRGGPLAMSEIVSLTRRYNLAPKQVRTLITQNGGQATRGVVEQVIEAARRLGGQRPRPTLSVRDAASGAIRSVLGLLNQADGRVATSTITTRRVTEFISRVIPFGSAEGNLLGSVAYAGGGIQRDRGDVANHHQPELAGPGMTRVWREPETQGEAYIPLANDYRRPRARAIAAETVALLGGEARFSEGAVLDMTRSLAQQQAATPMGRGSLAIAPAPTTVAVSLVGATFVADLGDLGEVIGTVVADGMDAASEMDAMADRAGAGTYVEGVA